MALIALFDFRVKYFLIKPLIISLSDIFCRWQRLCWLSTFVEVLIFFASYTDLFTSSLVFTLLHYELVERLLKFPLFAKQELQCFQHGLIVTEKKLLLWSTLSCACDCRNMREMMVKVMRVNGYQNGLAPFIPIAFSEFKPQSREKPQTAQSEKKSYVLSNLCRKDV